jgi:hypothetical protein
MIIILGLIILVAALVVAVAGIMGNAGSAHQVSHFSVLGYHLTGSSGTLFLAGIVVGAAGLLGLSLLLAGARRTSRRGSAARRGLQQSRRETAAATQERDDLIDQRDTARAYTASNLTSDSGTAVPEPQPGPAVDRWSRLRRLTDRLAPAQSPAQAPPDWPAAEVPASAYDDGANAASPIADPTADVPASAPDSAEPAVVPALSVDAGATSPSE